MSGVQKWLDFGLKDLNLICFIERLLTFDLDLVCSVQAQVLAWEFWKFQGVLVGTMIVASAEVQSNEFNDFFPETKYGITNDWDDDLRAWILVDEKLLLMTYSTVKSG